MAVSKLIILAGIASIVSGRPQDMAAMNKLLEQVATSPLTARAATPTEIVIETGDVGGGYGGGGSPGTAGYGGPGSSSGGGGYGSVSITGGGGYGSGGRTGNIGGTKVVRGTDPPGGGTVINSNYVPAMPKQSVQPPFGNVELDRRYNSGTQQKKNQPFYDIQVTVQPGQLERIVRQLASKYPDADIVYDN